MGQRIKKQELIKLDRKEFFINVGEFHKTEEKKSERLQNRLYQQLRKSTL